ncbi:MAG: O-antigen ligase family protein [Ruminococcus sp.]|nr:O-antigen ligase family protein [Ruminococcus sp.]
MANKKQTIQKTNVYNMRHAMVNYYLLLMLTFFEVFLTNQYASARTDKFILYIVLTSILIVSTIVISLSYSMDKNAPPEKRVVEQKRFFDVSSTDIAFLAFFFCACITTLLSDYKLDSLTGGAGRDNGLILLFLYTAMYFIVSRYYYFKNYVLCAFMVFGILISGLAILHFFYIDPLGIMTGYTQDVINDFGTTIGNKNTIAAYMCIFLPCAIMMFVVQKSRYVKILSAAAIVFAYCGLLVAGSNCGYIGFFAMLFFMALVCVRKPHLLKDLTLALTIMFSSGLLLRVFSFLMNDKSKGFERIGEMLVYSNKVYIIIAVFAVITVMLYLLKDSKFINSKAFKNTLTIIISLCGGLAVAVFTYFFCYYTFVDTTTDIGALSQILRFDDRWGTHRGFMWINGIKDYLQFDFAHIIFGSGCDTFYHVFEPHFEELSIRFNNGSTNNIHSEYLNYLVTQGVAGLASYLAIIITCVYRALKTSKNNELVLIFVFPVIAYCAQAVVNIYSPIVTPFLFIFIALCECLSRESNSVNKV